MSKRKFTLLFETRTKALREGRRVKRSLRSYGIGARISVRKVREKTRELYMRKHIIRPGENLYALRITKARSRFL
jgi:hypothetical protein